MGEQGESVTQLAVDLAVAWKSCRKVTERHFPGALERTRIEVVVARP